MKVQKTSRQIRISNEASELLEQLRQKLLDRHHERNSETISITNSSIIKTAIEQRIESLDADAAVDPDDDTVFAVSEQTRKQLTALWHETAKQNKSIRLSKRRVLEMLIGNAYADTRSKQCVNQIR